MFAIEIADICFGGDRRTELALERWFLRPRGGAVTLWTAAAEPPAAPCARPQCSQRPTLERMLRFGDFFWVFGDPKPRAPAASARRFTASALFERTPPIGERHRLA
jgi:hypothetical protein